MGLVQLLEGRSLADEFLETFDGEPG